MKVSYQGRKAVRCSFKVMKVILPSLSVFRGLKQLQSQNARSVGTILLQLLSGSFSLHAYAHECIKAEAETQWRLIKLAIETLLTLCEFIF